MSPNVRRRLAAGHVRILGRGLEDANRRPLYEQTIRYIWLAEREMRQVRFG